MSHYINWSPHDNYYYVKKFSKFESNPDGRSEGHTLNSLVWTTKWMDKISSQCTLSLAMEEQLMMLVEIFVMVILLVMKLYIL